MQKFYSSWVYWANPLSWVTRGLLGAMMHDLPVHCADDELVTFQPPQGQTCNEFAGEWLKTATGYIVNLDATTNCQYCTFKVGDEYLKTVHAK